MTRSISLTLGLAAFIISSAYAEPISLQNQGSAETAAQNQEQATIYPPATENYQEGTTQLAEASQVPPVDNDPYNYPATREELEQASKLCRQQVQELWQQKNSLPRYRQPFFQRSIIEAQERCKKLEELAVVIKEADEQLYTYKQNMQQAQNAFTG